MYMKIMGSVSGFVSDANCFCRSGATDDGKINGKCLKGRLKIICLNYLFKVELQNFHCQCKTAQ